MSATSVLVFAPAGGSPVTGFPVPTSPNNSFVTPWVDKRSAGGVGLSVIFYGATSAGTLSVEASNAPEKVGGVGQPQNNGDDAMTVASSSQSVSAGASTAIFQWQLATLPARWVRVRFTSSATTAGLLVNVYANAPHESP